MLPFFFWRVYILYVIGFMYKICRIRKLVFMQSVCHLVYWFITSIICCLCRESYSIAYIHFCKYVLTIWLTRRLSYKKYELLTIRLLLPVVIGRIRFAHLFVFSMLCLVLIFRLIVFCLLCFVLNFYLFVCLSSVSCLPNVANVLGLSILDGSFHVY